MTEQDLREALTAQVLDEAKEHLSHACVSCDCNGCDRARDEARDVLLAALAPLVRPAPPTDGRHYFEPHPLYLFCRHCGYHEHEPLKHTPRPSTPEGSAR